MIMPELHVDSIARRRLGAGRAFLPMTALVAACVLRGSAGAQSAPPGQSPQDIGAAIARTCTTIDPATQGVIAGVVTDSITGVSLPNARVKLVWQGPDDASAQTAEVETNKDGFYTFCNVPAGLLVLLTANLHVTSPPRTVGIDPGVLNVENIRLAISDPGKPGLLVGRIIDVNTRQPIDGVAVSLEQLHKQVLSNERGYFSFGEQPFGTYTLKLEHLAYKSREIPIHVAGNLTQNAEIEMTQQPIQLPGLKVSVLPRAPNNDIQGLIRRMALGFGDFVTRETLERRPDAKLADMLREVPGLSVFRNGDLAYLEVRGKPCDPDVYLDGQYYPLDPAVGVNEFNARDLEAIEVYKGTETPGEFVRPGFQYPCAAIVLWSHRVR
jgi:CarboxypepD_reg-like domain/TonB-dependent Receptor Plug Domain